MTIEQEAEEIADRVQKDYMFWQSGSKQNGGINHNTYIFLKRQIMAIIQEKQDRIKELESALKESEYQNSEMRKVCQFIFEHCDKDYTREIERPEFNAMMENLWNMAKKAIGGEH